MVNRNESIGGYGGGFGGYGGGWGIPPVGLFGVIGGFGNRGFGHDGGREHGGGSCCCDIRADIGETKFKVAEVGLENANNLQKEICNVNMQSKDNTFQVERELFGLQKDVFANSCKIENAVQAGDYALNTSILNQGWSTKLDNCHQTNALQKQISDCCCETNLNIERTSFATQLRDLTTKNDTDKQLSDLRCGQKEILAFIANQAKDCKIEALEKELRHVERVNDRLTDERVAGRTNCLITQLGDANRAFFGAGYAWNIPNCPC